MVSYNGTKYTYVHNLQGDIVGILDASGSLVVEYSYDAWGKPTAVAGGMAGTLGALNPFRYRGYVWDEETGLYYLRSRYSNPEIGRFTSTDGTNIERAGHKPCSFYVYANAYLKQIRNNKDQYLEDAYNVNKRLISGTQMPTLQTI